MICFPPEVGLASIEPMHTFLKIHHGVIAFFAWLSLAAAGLDPRIVQANESPNIVLIFADDLGYADIGSYGAVGYETPHLDRLAKEGTRFTDFYVAQPVCSASRAALLTGCYPNRVGILGALGPAANHGIHPDEMLMPELLKQRDVATAIFGKWHLGHRTEFLPTQHGFDEYFGLPYSNDMWPKHPTAQFPDLPLVEGEQIQEYNPDQTQLTTWYTTRAVEFIEKNKDRPFFLYLPHSMPHVPLFVSDKFAGKTERGLYGDVIAEIDWSVGMIMDALERAGVEDRTWVIFTSDNGPWLSYGTHGGSAKPLREGKGTTFEGGVRVPCIMKWPGEIPAGRVCTEPLMTIDLLPTMASKLGLNLPKHRIDGKDAWPVISNQPGARSPQEAYFFYNGGQLQAVRSGKWKLHFPHQYTTLAGRPGGQGGKPVPYSTDKIGLALFDLESDVGEKNNIAEEHPEVVKRLSELAERSRDDLGDALTKSIGKNRREPGRLSQKQ